MFSKGQPSVRNVHSASAKLLITKKPAIYYNRILQTTSFSEQRAKPYKNVDTVISDCGAIDIPSLQTHLFSSRTLQSDFQSALFSIKYSTFIQTKACTFK